jgi:hypothetical protein
MSKPRYRIYFHHPNLRSSGHWLVKLVWCDARGRFKIDLSVETYLFSSSGQLIS